jgi:hypothetical protein
LKALGPPDAPGPSIFQPKQASAVINWTRLPPGKVLLCCIGVGQMIKLIRFACAAILTLALSACARTVLTNIESFQNLPSKGDGRTVAILPGNKERPSELEFRSYSEKLAAHLARNGYRVVPASDSSKPD